MTIELSPAATPLADALRAALRDDQGLDALAAAVPAGSADRFTTLMTIYELHTAPLPVVGSAARYQHHPVVAALKTRCEDEWVAELMTLPLPGAVAEALQCDGALAAMRVLAGRDRIPPVYKWLARTAEWDDVVTFLALEG